MDPIEDILLNQDSASIAVELTPNGTARFYDAHSLKETLTLNKSPVDRRFTYRYNSNISLENAKMSDYNLILTIKEFEALGKNNTQK